jgi:tetratricopeptide (TPR) repeat protein
VSELTKRLESVLGGTQTLDELRTWAELSRHLYLRPDVGRFRDLDGPKVEALMNSYSDWEIRAAELGRAVKHALNFAEQHDADNVDDFLRGLEAAEVLSSLDSQVSNRAVVAFRLGYGLWQHRRFQSAIPHLRFAEETLRNLEGESWRELMALGYLVICLRDSKEFDDALEAAERFLARARALGIRSSEALALRDLGMVQSELGRNAAVENLQLAVAIAKQLSDEERNEYAVPDLGGFLNDLGVVARKRGDFEAAIGAFLDLAEFQSQRGQHDLEATAVSDLGYTYHQSGEDERAIHYLLKAAEIAERAGEYKDASRWRMQASAFTGAVASSQFDPSGANRPVVDSETAYEAGAVVEFLISQDRCQEALPLANRVLEWARKNKDGNLQIGQSNNVAICHARLGNIESAIPMFQQAIQLADGLRNVSASLMLRHGLATAFLIAKKTQFAGDVLLSAIGYGEMLLNSTPSTEVRQQISAGMLPIHELLASVLSQTGNHESMIAATEMARTRNLKTWMRAANVVAEAPSSEELRNLLKDLRATEIELEVREVAGTGTPSQIETIGEHRVALRKLLDGGLAAQGCPPVDWSFSPPTLDIRPDLAKVIATGDAVLFLFGVSGGVCAAAARTTKNGIEVSGDFIPWERQDRMAVVAPWLEAVSPSHSSRLTEERFEAAVELLRGRLAKPLANLCKSWSITNLIVVPQGELAIVPYWDLLELTAASGSLCLAPSLGVFELCTRRVRPIHEATLLVADVTGSVRHSRTELAFVRSARLGNIRETADIQEIKDAATSATVVHVAAHGIFNTENPYLGGLIVSDKSPTEVWFSQYVAHPRRFYSRPTPEGWPLLTAAACMADVTLDHCRLAVLSACESGIPRLHRGGEMTGLPNAFILAGAKSVIASLWRVHDAATAVLMHHFYDVWEGGRGQIAGVAQSLKEARKRLAHTSRAEVDMLLGPVHNLSEEYPFRKRFFTDAFHCFGAC